MTVYDLLDTIRDMISNGEIALSDEVKMLVDGGGYARQIDRAYVDENNILILEEDLM